MYHDISTYQYRSTPVPSSAQKNKFFSFKAYGFSFALIQSVFNSAYCLSFLVFCVYVCLIRFDITMSSNRRTSAIWQYFQEIKEDKKSNWICVICKTIGSCKNTSNQWKHLEIYHKDIWDEIKTRKQPPKKRRREDDNESNNLLDDDSERMDANAAAAGATGQSAATSATTSDNASRAGPSDGASGATG